MLLSGSDTGAPQRRAAPPAARPPPRRRAPERQPEQRAWERPPEEPLGGWGRDEGADGVGARDWWAFVSDGHFAAAAAEGTPAAELCARRWDREQWEAVGWRTAQWPILGAGLVRGLGSPSPRVDLGSGLVGLSTLDEGGPAPGGEAAALAALPAGEAAPPGQQQPQPPAAGGGSPREEPTGPLAIASGHRFGPLERRAHLALPPARPARWAPPRPAGPGSAGTSAPPSVPPDAPAG